MNDAIVALHWIQSNIVHFGGRPDAVTLFGQSSGAYMACTLCVSPAASGLFSRAILESGPCVGGPPGKGWGPMNRTRGAMVAREVMASLNVSSLAGLRAISNASLIQWPDATMNDPDIAPYFSGYFEDAFVVDGSLEERWATGRINPSALIIGHNSKDGTAAYYGTAPTLGLIPPDKQQVGEAAYMAALNATWGPLTPMIASHYPLSEFGGSAQAAFIQVDADVNVICPSILLATHATASNRSVWSYEFSHFQPGRPGGTSTLGGGCDEGVELDVVSSVDPAPSVWANHGAEVRYVFGITDGPDGLGPPHVEISCGFTSEEAALSAAMMRYWTSFAEQGNPNGVSRGGNEVVGAVAWPRFGEKRTTQRLWTDSDGGVGPAYALHDEKCRFWASLWK